MKNSLSAETESSLVVDRLSYRVGDRAILEAVSLAVRPGEVVGLIGPNGAGKTSLLRAIAALVQPSGGEVRLGEQSVARLGRRAIARAMARLPQSPDLPLDLSALELVLMGRHPYLGPFQMEGRRDLEVAGQALQATEALGLASRTLETLSGGERQRVLLAQALAQQPRVLLLDEPTANLDLRYQLQALELVRRLAREQGLAVVAALHDLSLAARFADRLLLLSEGRLLAEGKPWQVLTPQNLQAGFGIRALVHRDPLTGALAVSILDDKTPPAGSGARGRIHLICGCGSGARLMYVLHSAGFKVTLGPLSPNDTDHAAARALDVPVLTGRPFTPIDDSLHQTNLELIQTADAVVICDVPFGMGNLRNLAAAGEATRLVLVEERPFAERDHTQGRASALYELLRDRAVCVPESGLLQAVESIAMSDER